MVTVEKKVFSIIRPYFRPEEGSCVVPIVLKGHTFTFQALGKPPDLPSFHWTRTESQKTITRGQVKTTPSRTKEKKILKFLKFLIETHNFEGPAQLYQVEISDSAQHHSIRVPSGTALSNLTSVMAFFFLHMLCILCLPPSFQGRYLKYGMIHLGYFKG